MNAFQWVWLVVAVVAYSAYLLHVLNRWWNWDREGFLTDGQSHPGFVERLLLPAMIIGTWPVSVPFFLLAFLADSVCGKVEDYRVKRLERLGRRKE